MSNGKKLTWLTGTLFWGCIAFSLTLHVVVTIAHDAVRRHGAWAEAFQDFRLHLFAPGYNFFLIGTLNTLPFVLLAIFILFHLGTASQQEPVIVSRRLAGVAGALVIAVGLSAWAHIGTILHPDAQGALIYFFLPIYLMGLIPLGYAVGRLAGTLLFKQPVPPA
ncbi:MAG: hypothetical protein EXR97_03680 [Nitrospiraceae bacterium]|nr:hypothetical protein [Nitrospiraceae bacterium]MSR25352.1 hypothetical protein [Nitrospiraceae bacterium]